MHTALNEEEIIEYYDDDDVLEKKIEILAQYVKESQYFCTYTGAGISTAAGISDFRGNIRSLLFQPKSILIVVGPDGVWTNRAKGITPKQPSIPKGQAKPTLTHMALGIQFERKIDELYYRNIYF